MKIILISFFCTFVFMQETIDGLVAVVGENIVTQSEFFEQLSLLSQKQGINPKNNPQKYEKIAKKLLNNLINQYVLLEHAKKDTNIFVEDEKVREQLDLQIEGFIKELGSEKALENYFNKSIREIKSYYWEEIYNAMMIERFRYSLIGFIDVGKKEVYDFYNEVKDSLPGVPKSANFSVLNFSFKAGNKTNKKYYKMMQSIKDSIENKMVSFENMAKKHSDDFASAAKGGLVGETLRGTFLKEYEEASFSATIGSVVGPIKTNAGYHIIKVLDKKGEKITTQHILKTIQPSKEDKDSTINLINLIYDKANNDPSYLKTFLNNNKKYESDGYSGNYKNYFYENMPEEIVNFIDRNESGISTPFGFSNGSLGIIALYNKKKSEKSSLENSYDYISNIAKERKMSKYIDEWLISAKKEVYINIFIEN